MISVFENSFSLSQGLKDHMTAAVSKIASDYDLTIEYVNLVLMSDEQLLEINRNYLQHDYYTDIITFNYSEDETVLEAELYMSYDRVRDNAVENGSDIDEELMRVVIHGMLHLAGFNDAVPEEKAEMRSWENKYLLEGGFHVKQP